MPHKQSNKCKTHYTNYQTH